MKIWKIYLMLLCPMRPLIYEQINRLGVNMHGFHLKKLLNKLVWFLDDGTIGTKDGSQFSWLVGSSLPLCLGKWMLRLIPLRMLGKELVCTCSLRVNMYIYIADGSFNFFFYFAESFNLFRTMYSDTKKGEPLLYCFEFYEILCSFSLGRIFLALMCQFYCSYLFLYFVSKFCDI